MSLPAPPFSLADSCSTIYQNTLFSFSPAGFQSLELTQGATWQPLSSGVSVAGAACVQATAPDGQTALYVVGGNNSPDPTYEGLQRYVFSSSTWETITPETAVAQNRVSHAAAWLQDASMLVIYAGSQDGSTGLTTSTFTIGLAPPYSVLAYESSAPPATNPILLPWSTSQVMMLGGSTFNTEVMLFDATNHWTNSTATLAAPLSSDVTRAVMIQGSDGSKNVYTFDMGVSPNLISRYILVDAYGNDVAGSSPVTRSLHARLAARDGLPSEENWPTYNATLAPTTTRTDYAVALGDNGLVVISGGGDDAHDPLCMFNAYDNSWQNATEALVATPSSSTSFSAALPSHTSLSTTASSTDHITTTSASVTASPTRATSSAATTTAAAADDAGADYTKVLAAVLSSVLGALVILVIALLLLRWRRGKGKQPKHHAHSEKHYQEPYYPPEPFRRGHLPQDSHASISSMAILMNNMSGSGHKRGVGKGRGSDDSNGSSMFNKKFSHAISRPIPQQPRTMTPDSFLREKRQSFSEHMAARTMAAADTPVEEEPAPQDPARRSSGWNRYFSGGNALNTLGLTSSSKRSTYGSDASHTSQSQYTERMVSVATQPSAVVHPLHIDRPFDRPGINSVSSNSPTVTKAAFDFPLAHGMTGQIERAPDRASVSTYDDDDDDDRHDAYSSGVPASVHEDDRWTPIPGQAWGGNRDSRVASSTYSQTQFPSGVPSGVPTGGSAQLQTGAAAATTPSVPHRASRDVSFSHPFPTATRPRGDANMEGHTSDVSWLNLGAESSRI